MTCYGGSDDVISDVSDVDGIIPFDRCRALHKL